MVAKSDFWRKRKIRSCSQYNGDKFKFYKTTIMIPVTRTTTINLGYLRTYTFTFYINFWHEIHVGSKMIKFSLTLANLSRYFIYEFSYQLYMRACWTSSLHYVKQRKITKKNNEFNNVSLREFMMHRLIDLYIQFFIRLKKLLCLVHHHSLRIN